MEVVSVLVPLYNNKAFICNALNSALKERPERIELLVLDDGSNDGSSDVATAWIADNHNRFVDARIWRRENKGIAATLNELVRNASGEYIAILPADDELLPGGIDARLDALKKNSDMLCVFGDAVVVDQDGAVVSDSALFSYPKKHVSPHSWALRDPELMTLELIVRWAVPGPVFLARKELYSSETGIGQYDESLAAEDRDFYLRNLARKTLVFVQYKVANYRVHGNNVSTHVDTSRRVKTSVFESERKNLSMFTGINRAALNSVYRYKKAVGSIESSDGSFERLFYISRAIGARFIMRMFDLLQLARRVLT